MSISDWSSDVCSSDLGRCAIERAHEAGAHSLFPFSCDADAFSGIGMRLNACGGIRVSEVFDPSSAESMYCTLTSNRSASIPSHERSEEHTSELQSLMRISYAVFCLKKKNKNTQTKRPTHYNHIKDN